MSDPKMIKNIQAAVSIPVMAKVRIGHFVEALNKLVVETVIVRASKELENLDGLILPGGESTAIGKLLEIFSLKEKLLHEINSGLPVWATCAGMII